ncbi:DUF2612 domain-containing protein [Xenorhabdus bovienii]|nr:DUF2612 domain-containing protein [Xenorhabdus bovienii]
MAVNVLTAQGFGLDIWGRIIGINRGFTSPLSHQCGQWSVVWWV